MGNTTCSIDGCAGAVAAKKMCSKHYWRVKKTGDPNKTPSGRVVRDRPLPCAVDGCDRVQRKLAWCAPHYAQYQRTGTVSAMKYRWREDAGLPCVVCSKPVEGRRKYCSRACIQLKRRYPDGRPAEKPCAICGSAIDLSNRGSLGQLQRNDVEMCDRCRKARHTRHGVSLNVMVAHQGHSNCGICGLHVDLSLNYRDPMAPQIDHIMPFAKGGTHDIENLQLAHYRCNVRKQARLDYRPDFSTLR